MSVIIGIPCAIDENKNASLIFTYSKAIEAAGALPLLIPYLENKNLLSDYISLCDGFLFSGGADVDPAIYGEEKKPTCDEIAHFRDELETQFFEAVFASKKPILAICRGAQLINALLGGTLYQDIPTETDAVLCHRQTEPKFEFSHDVTVKKDSPLFKLTGKERIRANSFHHQAIKALGEGLSVMSYADDGIIEGVYHTSHPYLRAYQWHPERIFEKCADNKLIFTDFINACKGRSK